MIRTLFVSLVTAVLLPIAALADVYIDPTATCPGSGAVSAPLCTWPTTFVGGEVYRQKAGTTWRGEVYIHAGNRSASDAVLTLGAYGAGQRPIIRAENSLPDEGWTEQPDSTWTFSTSGYREPDPVILLTRGVRLRGPAVDCQRGQWMYSPGLVTLCIAPYAVTSMAQPTKRDPSAAIRLYDQRRIVIDGLDLQGGHYGAIEIRGTSGDIEIRNNRIGKDALYGVRAYDVTATITGLDIHDNVIDSGVRLGALGYELPSGEGVYLQHRVQGARIMRNEFIAWPHNGVYLYGMNPDSAVLHNLIAYNNFHCGPHSSYWDYCRPLSIDGVAEGAASNNIVTGNWFHDFSVRIQFNGNDNVFVNNQCWNVSTTSAKSFRTDQCIDMQGYQWSRNNVIIGNTLEAVVSISPGAKYTGGHVITGNQLPAQVVEKVDPSIGPNVILRNYVLRDDSDGTGR